MALVPSKISPLSFIYYFIISHITLHMCANNSIKVRNWFLEIRVNGHHLQKMYEHFHKGHTYLRGTYIFIPQMLLWDEPVPAIIFINRYSISVVNLRPSLICLRMYASLSNINIIRCKPRVNWLKSLFANLITETTFPLNSSSQMPARGQFYCFNFKISTKLN